MNKVLKTFFLLILFISLTSCAETATVDNSRGFLSEINSNSPQEISSSYPRQSGSGDPLESSSTNGSPEASLLEKWGFGKNETEYVTLNRDYNWYIDQANTGYASAMNCGPCCAVMAAKWQNKNFPKSVQDARDAFPNNGGWWYYSYISDFLSDNDIPCETKYGISADEIESQLDKGNILIVAINTKDITYNGDDEQRTGRFYGAGGGHFILYKRIPDSGRKDVL